MNTPQATSTIVFDAREIEDMAIKTIDRIRKIREAREPFTSKTPDADRLKRAYASMRDDNKEAIALQLRRLAYISRTLGDDKITVSASDLYALDLPGGT